jgi:hypothetical protein
MEGREENFFRPSCASCETNERKNSVDVEQKRQPKKAWTKPELTVLARNKPEEQVLSGCKVTSASVGSGNGASNCASALGCGYPCDVYVSS